MIHKPAKKLNVLTTAGNHVGTPGVTGGQRQSHRKLQEDQPKSPIAMPGKRSRAVAAALSHPDLSPAPGLVLAPVFTAASAAPAAPSSPLPDWPAPTGECPPHPQRSPSLLPALRTFHRWQGHVARMTSCCPDRLEEILPRCPAVMSLISN